METDKLTEIEKQARAELDREIKHTTPPFFEEEQSGKIFFHSVNMIRYLDKSGFKYITENGNYSFVQIENNIIRAFDLQKIKTFINDKLKEQVYEKKTTDKILVKWQTTQAMRITETTLINDLDEFEFKPPADNPETSCYYFKNCVIEVSVNGIRQVEYKDLKRQIWESQIIDRDYTGKFSGEPEGDFRQFIHNITNPDEIPEDESAREMRLITAIGRSLHDWRTRPNKKAFIFTDVKSSSGNPTGRAGKGLIHKAISKVRNVIEIDGKTFNPERNFALQRVRHDTQCIFVEDIPGSFNWETLFNMVTDILRIEEKHKKEIVFQQDQLPQWSLNTNSTLRGDSASHRGRRIEVEILNTYNEYHTPTDDFKKSFWSIDWTVTDWNDFYYFMFYCSLQYFKNGREVTDFDSETMKLKRFEAETCKGFKTFADGLERNSTIYQPDLQKDAEVYLGINYSVPKLKKWLKTYCYYIGLEFDEGRDRTNRFVMIIENPKRNDF